MENNGWIKNLKHKCSDDIYHLTNSGLNWYNNNQKKGYEYAVGYLLIMKIQICEMKKQMKRISLDIGSVRSILQDA